MSGCSNHHRQLQKKRRAQAKLRQQRQQDGVIARSGGLSQTTNRTCEQTSLAEEQHDRVETTALTLQHLKNHFRELAKRFSEIPDPRNPRKIKHKKTVLLLYGVMMFVLRMSSRRESNREMTRPSFAEALRQVIPDLEDCPHNDTVMRFLSVTRVTDIEAAMVDFLRQQLRKKRFAKHVFDGRYRLAIDGTQKLSSKECWDDRLQVKQVQKKDGPVTRYAVYVVEASLSFGNGLMIPLMSEFLTAREGEEYGAGKKDCELVAAKRLLGRIKDQFPRLPIMVLLDGLYANGPMIEFLRQRNWDFMIVLREKSLSTVWEEYHGLRQLAKASDEQSHQWGPRSQRFFWVNEIEYDYEVNGRTRTVLLHVVVCDEQWDEIDTEGNQVTRTKRFSWLSNKPLTRRNVVGRCNECGRHRWGIEEEFLVEKHHGFQYEHALAHSWNALLGYHFLLRLGLLLNVLILHAHCFRHQVKRLGQRGFIQYIRTTMGGNWFPGMEEVISRIFSRPVRISLE